MGLPYEGLCYFYKYSFAILILKRQFGLHHDEKIIKQLSIHWDSWKELGNSVKLIKKQNTTPYWIFFFYSDCKIQAYVQI